MPAAVEMIYC